MHSPVDWLSSSSEILSNPRLPAALHDSIAILKERSSSYPSHVFLATSGSTLSSPTASKWMALSKHAVLASAQAVNQHLGATASDIWFHSLPDFHAGGIGIWARAFLSKSAVVKSSFRSWSPAQFVHEITQSQATLTSLVPAQVYDLVSLGLKAPPSLRAAVVGGGALDPKIYQQARQFNWNLLPSYGLTECASQVATAPLSSLENFAFPPLHILSHIEAAITSEGYLSIKSPSLLTAQICIQLSPLGAHQVEVEDPKVGGWYLTQDRASLNFPILSFHGRDRDFFKIGGESTNLQSLENTLLQIKQALQFPFDLTVLPYPDPRLGHVVHLVCAPSAHPALQSLVEAFNVQVHPYEKIRQVHHLPSIPRSSLGKVLREQLLKAISSLGE